MTRSWTVLAVVVAVVVVTVVEASPVFFFDTFVPGVRKVFLDDIEEKPTTPKEEETTEAPMLFMDADTFVMAPRHPAPAEEPAVTKPPSLMFFDDTPRGVEQPHGPVTGNRLETPALGSRPLLLFHAPTDSEVTESAPVLPVATGEPTTSEVAVPAGAVVDASGWHFPSDISAEPEGHEDGEEPSGPVPGLGLPNRSARPGSCLLEDGRITYNGSCERILAKGPCNADEWLVVVEGASRCAPRPCPWGQVPFQDRCIDPNDLEVCDKGQIIYVDFSGSAMCDCDHGFLYDSWSGHCFARHDKGSCNWGEYLDELADGTVHCVRNPCRMSGWVQDTATGKCYYKQYKGYCETPLFYANNRTAECLDIAGHNILDVPTMRACPEGSIRDFVGECRQTFHVPTLTSFPVLHGMCPGGFALVRGTCRKTSRLFG